ncbi:HTH-type transcriptional regulator GlpR [Halococcus sp. PRR34]|uniref:HTH-type transcriptional regulator GlpR n=1 Tax=Halococcus sp. PRR34 TaxID=3020830 RepID=UPI00236161F8|nr:HTH-type transcriptional regulator GlpR [Halococcus sp. PRR34]
MSSPKERHRNVVELVAQRDGLSVEELAQEVSVSESTIRRDLRELADRDLLERTHGGAVPITNSGLEPSFERRVVQQLDQKQAIATRAIEEIQEEQIVYFDAGTTTMQVAREGSSIDLPFIAVTNSPLLTPILSQNNSKVMLTGGEFRDETKALIGPTTDEFVRASNFDLAFLGVNGINLNGELSTPNEAEATLKRSVIENSTRSVIVTTTDKFGEQSFRQFGSISDIDLLITNERVPDEFRELFSDTDLIENTSD